MGDYNKGRSPADLQPRGSMDYNVFESRALEIYYKTSDRVTAQLAAYRIGCGVAQAKAFLETMVANGIVEMESDERGSLHFELPSRPAPSGLPVSWISESARNAQVPAIFPGATPMHDVAPQRPQWNVPQGHVQSTHVQIHNVMPAMVFVAQDKSVGLAVVLALVFGPLGMFYSTVGGAIVMMFVGTVIMVGTLGIGIVLVLPMCMLWAGMSASSNNRNLRMQTTAAVRG